MKTPFIIEKKLTLGELMTVISIVFSAASVMLSWRNEQKIQVLENATKTRVAIAKTLNTVHQVVQIQLSFYELIEEDIVEASRIAIVEKQSVKARDYMWEKCFKHKAEVLNIISQNDWEVAYTNLLTYGITIDSLYIKSINRLKGIQQNQFNLLTRDFESEILRFDPKITNQTSLLIDKLRNLKKEYRNSHLDYSKRATLELNSFCLNLISSPDHQLIFPGSTTNE